MKITNKIRQHILQNLPPPHPILDTDQETTAALHQHLKDLKYNVGIPSSKHLLRILWNDQTNTTITITDQIRANTTIHSYETHNGRKILHPSRTIHTFTADPNHPDSITELEQHLAEVAAHLLR